MLIYVNITDKHIKSIVRNLTKDFLRNLTDLNRNSKRLREIKSMTDKIGNFEIHKK